MFLGSHVECVHMFYASPCVFINCVQVGMCVCVVYSWHREQPQGSYKFDQTRADMGTHAHQMPERNRKQNFKQQRVRQRPIRYVCCGNYIPAVTSMH